MEQKTSSTPLRMWREERSWHDAETEWDNGAARAAESSPIQSLKHLPKMVGITPDTAKNLKWKSLKWMIAKDHQRKILKGFLKHPLKYTWQLLKSSFKKKPFKRQGDFFLYGLNDLAEFESLIQDEKALLIVGFSYCHKPFECPSGRFSPDCIHDPLNNVCRQCFIGKAMNALPQKNSSSMCIPTIHDIGAEIFRLIDLHPTKMLIFMITACEMTLEMFGDWGNMVALKGIGIRLDGRICNTMRAFELSELGTKPGLTTLLPPTQSKILELLHLRYSSINQ